ncbi:hypothetical protein CR513_22109, partial [Mucuna pruriens]
GKLEEFGAFGNHINWRVKVESKTFQALHLKKPWFITIVHGSPRTSIRSLINDFKEEVKSWNKRCLMTYPNPFLFNLQKKLLIELELIIQRIINKLQIFHCTAVVRRKKNFMEKLQDQDGVWVFDKSQLQQPITNFFKHEESYVPFELQGCFPSIDPAVMLSVSKTYSQMEIRNALFHMGAFKVRWERWTATNIVQSLNKTLITLIPKVETTFSLKRFRPISLCNITYKLLTKALAQSLKKVMKTMISLVQCSFVPEKKRTRS